MKFIFLKKNKKMEEKTRALRTLRGFSLGGTINTDTQT